MIAVRDPQPAETRRGPEARRPGGLRHGRSGQSPTMTKRLLTALLSLTFVLGAAACGDDPGEDRIGDGEINDEGD